MPVNADNMTESNAELLQEITALLLQVKDRLVQIDGSEPAKSNAQTFFETGLLWTEKAAKTK